MTITPATNCGEAGTADYIAKTLLKFQGINQLSISYRRYRGDSARLASDLDMAVLAQVLAKLRCQQQQEQPGGSFHLPAVQTLLVNDGFANKVFSDSLFLEYFISGR